jgi:hypothetical protein
MIPNFIISFGMQYWNETYDKWHPNDTPLDFIINGEKQLPASHLGFWWAGEITPMMPKCDSLEWFDYPAQRNREVLEDYRNIKLINISNLENQKYIYPIFLLHWAYFCDRENYGFDAISQRVLDDVKRNQAKIVLINMYEGCYGGRDFEVLNSWCSKAGLEKDQVYLIQGNFNKPNDLDLKFTYIPVQSFLPWIPTQSGPIPFSPSSNKNLFLCYNRANRQHRALVMCDLIKQGLFNRGIVSYRGAGEGSVQNLINIFNRSDLIDAARELEKQLPLTLEHTDLNITNPAKEINYKHHAETFLSLVTETLVREETCTKDHDPIFFSEKTWKPIAAGQPFIVVASPGHLQELKNQGYQTFDKWWNESYDNEPDLQTRIELIMLELLKLSKLSTSELIKLRVEMHDVVKHNQDLFNYNRKEIYKENEQEGVYIEIKKIWESF